MEESKIVKLAEKYINQTGQAIFLTGKAGTGKTTFLRNLKSTTPKSLVIAAPTGIAAVNAGGSTLHSLFNLKQAMFLPKQPAGAVQFKMLSHEQVLSDLGLSLSKIELLRNLDLLVIDEVSMLRADLLDMIDLILKHIRNAKEQAFGGVQLLFIGDLFQLPPVITEQEKPFYYSHYSSPYFFDAEVIKQSSLSYLELDKIYRQKDTGFIDLLNNIRHNQISQQDLDTLNKKVVHDKNDFNEVITLTSHIDKVEELNSRKLKELNGELFVFAARTSGQFKSKSFPGEMDLKLKNGAPVIMIKNDPSPQKRYYNGRIGKVKQIDDFGITITFSKSEEDVFIQRDSWKNISYGNEHNGTSGDIVGEITQFPLRLAWAITIHKSQGLSFEKAVVDAASSFSEGQVYVALSRLTNFEGLYLSSKINMSSLMQNQAVVNFVSKYEKEGPPEIQLEEDRLKFLYQLLSGQFNFRHIFQLIQLFVTMFDNWQIANKFAYLGNAENLSVITGKLLSVSEKFRGRIQEELFKTVIDTPYIHKRTKDAVSYFDKRINLEMLPLARNLLTDAKKNRDQKEYVDFIKKIIEALESKQGDLNQAAEIVSGLDKSEEHANILDNFFTAKNQKPVKSTEKVQNPTGKKNDKQSTQLKTLEAFRSGLSIEEITTKRNLAQHVVESHVSDLVLNGSILIHEILSAEQQQALMSLILPDNFEINELKIKVGSSYSFFEIRVAINYVIYKGGN